MLFNLFGKKNTRHEKTLKSAEIPDANLTLAGMLKNQKKEALIHINFDKSQVKSINFLLYTSSKLWSSSTTESWVWNTFSDSESVT